MYWLEQVAFAVLGALFGVVLGPLAVLFTPVGDRLRLWLLSRSGELSGEWKQIVSPGYHKPHERIDRLQVYHHNKTNRLSVYAEREEPYYERGVKWRIEGYVRGDEATLTFWSIGAGHDGASFGAIFLHREAQTAGRRWVGYYFRPGTDTGRTVGESNLKPLKLVWVRL